MIFGVDKMTIEEAVVREMKDRGLSLAVFETNTGGSMVSRLTGIPGGMRCVRQGLCLSLAQASALLPEDIRGKEEISDFFHECIAIS